MDTKHRSIAICLLCVMVSILLSSFSLSSASSSVLYDDAYLLVSSDFSDSFSICDSALTSSGFPGLGLCWGPSVILSSGSSLYIAPTVAYLVPTFSPPVLSGFFTGEFSTLTSSYKPDLVSEVTNVSSFLANNVFVGSFSDVTVSSDGTSFEGNVSLSHIQGPYKYVSFSEFVGFASSGVSPSDPTFPSPSSDQYAQSRAIWEYKEGVKPSTYTLLYDIAINQGLALSTIADNSTAILKLLQNGVGSGSGSGSGSSLIPMDIWAPDISDLPLHSAGGFIHDIWNSITNVMQSHLVNLDNYAGATYNYQQGMLQRFGFGSSIGMSEYNPVTGSSTRTVSNLGQALNTINDNIMYGGLIQNDFISRIETLYASDEDIAFQESQQETVDQVKDDFFGDDPAFSPSTSSDAKSAVNGVVSGFSGGTDITFGQAVAVMGDTSAWGQFFTQAVSDSLDTSSSAAIAVIANDDLSYIDDIPPDAIHVPSQPTFSDLYPDYVEGE